MISRFPSTALVSGALLLLSLSGAHAQPLRGGVRLGPAFGFLNDSATPFVSTPNKTSARTNVRIDGHLGVHLIVPFNERWALQPEVQFIQKGGHLSRVGSDIYTSEQYRLSYVQLHALGRRAIALPGPLSLSVVGGVTGSVLTGATVRRDRRSESGSVGERINLRTHDLVRRWDVGALIGGGIGYSVGAQGRFALDLRYHPGFRSLFTSNQRPASLRGSLGLEPPPLTDTPPTLRHDVILVSVAYTLPLVE